MGFFSFAKRGKIEYVVAGLGNPGSRYADNRHNAGFKALDLLAKEESFEFKKLKFKALIADEVINGKRCLIMKPQTMMNLSGDAIYDAVQYYNIPDENVIILFDDVTLDIGKTRIRRKGSAGGHNGIKSIISALGSEEFPRVKIGVGKKPPEWDMKDWVLSDFPKADEEALNSALKNSVEALKLIVDGKIDEAMNLYNG